MQKELVQAKENDTKRNSGAFLLNFYVLVTCVYVFKEQSV